jgi:predicted MFS family arabinose efflux permease
VIAAAPARGGILASSDFRRLWFVGFVIFVVRWLEMLAMGVYTYERTGSPFLVALLTMLRLLPMALFGAVMGAVADRFERRNFLVATVLCLFAGSSTLFVLALTGKLAVWQLAVATFINGITWSSDNPVRRILIGEVVGTGKIGRAMSLDVGTNNATRFLGPTLGGALLVTTGIAGVFALSMSLYAMGLAAALGIRHRTGIRAEAAGALFARIREGLDIVRRDKRIVGTLVITVIYNVFGWPFTSMIPVIAQDRLQLDPGGIGLLASMDGLGAFAGAAIITLFARPAAYARLYLCGTALYLVAVPAFALATDALASGTALLCTGLTGAAFSTMQATLIYVLAPSEIRSRIFGVLSVCIGLGPLGFLHLGLMADWIGAPHATALIGLEGIVVLAATHRLWQPVLRA